LYRETVIPYTDCPQRKRKEDFMTNTEESIEHIIQSFIGAEPEQCDTIKNYLILAVNTSTAATEAAFLLYSRSRF
jgi:hypothetical protein